MKALRLALAGLAALFAAACPPVTTTAPVGSTAGFVNDPVLDGLWSGHFDSDAKVTYFHFVPRADNTITVISITPRLPQHAAEWNTYRLTSATLGGHQFVNLRLVLKDGVALSPTQRKANIPMRYVADGNTLTFYLLDEDKVRTAITTHEIGGRTRKRAFGDNTTITTGAKALDMFLGTPEGLALFGKPFLVLKKVE
jgi:hypothetical protein